MYFDFEDYRPDITPVGSAVSWRLKLAASIVVHTAAILLLLAGGKAAVMSVPEALALAAQQTPPDEPTRFVFVEPRVDIRARTPSPDAPLSDEHRRARTPELPRNPLNELPFSKGNTPDLVEERPTEAARKQAPATQPAPEPQPPFAEAPPSDNPTPQNPDRLRLPESQSARVNAPAGPPPAARAPRPRPTLPSGALGDALRNLDRYVQADQFDNPQGGSTQPGPGLQFETYGIDFGKWIVQFKAQVEGNWRPLIPRSTAFSHGHVVLTFNVHKNGSITDVTVIAPAAVPAFNTAAYGAIVSSNPTLPLPPEYPVEKAFITATFYYNERPPR